MGFDEEFIAVYQKGGNTHTHAALYIQRIHTTPLPSRPLIRANIHQKHSGGIAMPPWL